MNEKFFSLPAEKQQAILNAGYHWKYVYQNKGTEGYWDE